MVPLVVLRAKPAHIKRLAVIIVMGVSLSPANFAWLFCELPIPHRIVNRVVCPISFGVLFIPRRSVALPPLPSSWIIAVSLAVIFPNTFINFSVLANILFNTVFAFIKMPVSHLAVFVEIA